jgi:hypothetical protein
LKLEIAETKEAVDAAALTEVGAFPPAIHMGSMETLTQPLRRSEERRASSTFLKLTDQGTASSASPVKSGALKSWVVSALMQIKRWRKSNGQRNAADPRHGNYVFMRN